MHGTLLSYLHYLATTRTYSRTYVIQSPDRPQDTVQMIHDILPPVDTGFILQDSVVHTTSLMQTCHAVCRNVAIRKSPTVGASSRRLPGQYRQTLKSPSR